MSAVADKDKAAEAKDKPKRRSRKPAELNQNEVRLKELRSHFKEMYVQPPLDQIPYNRNMARQFNRPENETVEQMQQRQRQKEMSRISRDRLKYVDEMIRQESEKLQKEMLNVLVQLHTAEQVLNACNKKRKRPAIDWKATWGV